MISRYCEKSQKSLDIVRKNDIIKMYKYLHFCKKKSYAKERLLK